MLIHALTYFQICIHSRLRRFAIGISGATAIEYGLIVGGISVVIMASVFIIGGDLGGMFSFIADKMAFINTKAK